MKNGKGGKSTYAGSIKNTGSQHVGALFDSGASAVGHGKVITGDDLRNGVGGTKKKGK